MSSENTQATHQGPDSALQQPSSSSGLPHLELSASSERRELVHVALRPSALTFGLHTSTCPQCGLNPAGPAVKMTFEWVPRWVSIGFFVNLVVLWILYMAGRKVVRAEIPLCVECASADRRGRFLRRLSYIGPVIGPIAFGLLGAMTLGLDAAIGGFCVGLVAGIAGTVASHRGTRFDIIGVKHIDLKHDTMLLSASPSFQHVVAVEAPDALVR